MGFLDAAIGELLGSANTGTANAGAATTGAPLEQALGALLQQHGGIGGLVNQLSQGGLATQVASWIGSGQNQAVTANEITQALGSTSVGAIAQKLGINAQEVSTILAQAVPHLINHMTPGGQLPANAGELPQGDVLAAAARAIAARLLG